MNSLDMVTNLLRGGFELRDAAQIAVLMSECFDYNMWDGLLQLEDIALSIEDEELWVPQPWLGELLYLRDKNERQQQRRMRGRY